jgi:hypothetical protein
VNIYIDEKTAWFDWFNPNVPKGLFYPILIVRQVSTISDSLANEVRNTLLFALSLQTVGFWLLIGVAIASFFIGFTLFVFTVPHLKKRADYEPINEPSDT